MSFGWRRRWTDGPQPREAGMPRGLSGHAKSITGLPRRNAGRDAGRRVSSLAGELLLLLVLVLNINTHPRITLQRGSAYYAVPLGRMLLLLLERGDRSVGLYRLTRRSRGDIYPPGSRLFVSLLV